MKIEKKVAPVFEDFVFNWDYERYLLIGGYGSGKSYHVAFKIILKLLQEKRKALVIRDVYDTIHDSCFDLIKEILDDMGLIDPEESNRRRKGKTNKVRVRESPMKFVFPNGSQIIFKGMDKPAKVKSINGISIVWIEECSEIKYDAYKELLGRLRTPNDSMHFILSCNPIGRHNWIYQHFFTFTHDSGEQTIYMDEQRFYDNKNMISKGTYYHHSVPTDNPWLPWQYLKRLDDLKNYDYPLYTVARWGMFGATGTRVLPQFKIAHNAKQFKQNIESLGYANHYFGFDFGFEESFNAVISCAVDIKKGVLYIYDEIYKNHLTDDQFAALPEMQRLMMKLNNINNGGINKMLIADSEDPKAISYYRQSGFKIRGCKNRFPGSRISNTRKIKRFKKIVVSPKCTNVIKELKDLTYKKDSKGNVIYDQFNIDPHTFSAIWYALDNVTVADVKDRKVNSKAG